jgi:putative transposase
LTAPAVQTSAGAFCFPAGKGILPRRKVLRLPEYDYRTPAGYFITARTWKGSLLFNGAGFFRAVRQAWEALPAIFGGIELDECVVMPNHFHGIVWVFDDRA